jgi:hypothetical protein
MSKAGRGIKRLMQEVRWAFIGLGWKLKSLKPQPSEISNEVYTIGITTYIERLHSYLIPLIKQLHFQFPDTQIIVAINGYHNAEKQQAFLKEIRTFLDQYPNVSYFDYAAPQGLCTLWNGIVLRSKTEKMLLCNEDLKTSKTFRSHLESSRIFDHEFALINGSYSHFMISKKMMSEVGWFDERFPGIGYEDHDYEIRMAMKGHVVKEVNVDGLKNETAIPKDWSYGDDHSVIFGKYSGPNGDHYFKKWSISDTPKDGYIKVRILQGYAMLNEGMETPDFHPDKL